MKNIDIFGETMSPMDSSTTINPTPIEKDNSETSEGIIPNFDTPTNTELENSVTSLPSLPVENGTLKLFDFSTFKKVTVDFKIYDGVLPIKDLESFVASAPGVYPYHIEITKKNAQGKAIQAQVIYEKASTSSDKNPQMIQVSKVAYYHMTKTHNLDNGIHGCILNTFRDGKATSIAMTMADVVDNKKLTTTLVNSGVLISNGAQNRDYIFDQNLECDNTKIFVNTLGFRYVEDKLCYIYPNGKGIKADIYYSQQDPTLQHALGTKGDSEIWIDYVIRALNLNNEAPTIPFLFFSSLMPLFSTLIPEFQGILINIIPASSEKLTSSSGKTTMQRAMLSMQGAQEWMISWNTTANAVENKLHDGFGAYFDDLSTGNIKNMEKVVYDNANGSERARLNQDSTAKKVKQRKTVIYSSGEDHVLKSGEVKDGSLVRAIDIELKPSDFGSDDANHTKEVADNIKATVHNHYGFVYRVVVPMIIEQEELILEQVSIYKAHFSAMANDPLSKRLAMHYAIIAVCGELMIIALQKIANDTSLLSGLDALGITTSLFKKQIQIFKVGDEKNLGIIESIKQAISIEGDDIHNLFRTSIGVVKNNICYIKSTEITAILEALPNVNSNRFCKWAVEEGYICESDNASKSFTKTRRINGTSVKTYAFNFDVKTDGNTSNGSNNA